MRLLAGGTMQAPEACPFEPGRLVLFSAGAPGAPPEQNEDAAAVVPAGPGRGVLAVADGLGGQRGGESASRHAMAAIASAVGLAGDAAGSLRGAILDALERSDRELRTHAPGAATTVVAAELDGAKLRTYHVGDSAVLVVGQRGRIKLLTVAHSPVGYAVEAGLLDEREALHHAERHLVSNAVGTGEMRIEVGSPLTLSPRDTLLLATDGLFDNLHVAEIVQRIRSGDLLEAAGALVAEAQARMRDPKEDRPSKPDDLTLLLFRPGA